MASTDLEGAKPQEAQGRQQSEELFRNGDSVAWEPAELDLWVPYRVRGSWRGGVLG